MCRTTENDISIEDIADQLEDIFGGHAVLEIESGNGRGLGVWIIRIKFDDGTFIKILIVKKLGKVLEIEIQEGPFDFDFDPEGSFITLQEAIEVALGEVPGEVVRVELELEEDNQWEFEIHIINSDGKWEVEVDAFTGDVIGVKQKNEGDDDDFEKPGDEAPQDILDIALEIVAGEVVHSEKKGKGDRSYYKIFIETEGGAIVRLKLELEGDLIEVKGKDEPFDYEVEPGDGLINFSEAKEIALEEVGGELDEWKLRMKETDDMLLWIYQFEIQDGDVEWEVKIDALTGEVLEVEMDEDDDDDGDEDEDDEGSVPDDIIEKAESIVDGEVVKAEREDDVWELVMVTDDGSFVHLEISEDGELIEAKGKESPFEYDFDPGDDFVGLGEAIDTVESYYEGETTRWHFEETDGGKWVYKFWVEGAGKNSKVYVNAETGEICDHKDDDEDDGKDEIPQDLKDKALEIVDGEIIEGEFEAGVWEIYVRTEAGSKVEMEFDAESGDLLTVEGEQPPFDYEVNPGDDFILFSEAREVLFENFDGEILAWEFSFDDIDGWVYEFEMLFEGDDFGVTIDAASGEVIE